MADETTDTPAWDEWCIVELLGHRRLAGRVREVQLAGAGFLRLDIPDGQTQLVSPSSVYALHPVGEEVARAVAARCRPEPVQRWELPVLPTCDACGETGRHNAHCPEVLVGDDHVLDAEDLDDDEEGR